MVMQRIANPCTAVRFRSEPRTEIFMKKAVIVGAADAKINERGLVSEDSSVLSIQRDCAIEAPETQRLRCVHTSHIWKATRICRKHRH